MKGDTNPMHRESVARAVNAPTVASGAIRPSWLTIDVLHILPVLGEGVGDCSRSCSPLFLSSLCFELNTLCKFTCFRLKSVGGA